MICDEYGSFVKNYKKNCLHNFKKRYSIRNIAITKKNKKSDKKARNRLLDMLEDANKR